MKLPMYPWSIKTPKRVTEGPPDCSGNRSVAMTGAMYVEIIQFIKGVCEKETDPFSVDAKELLKKLGE